MASYNPYQKMHYEALYGNKKKEKNKPKTYELYSNSVFVMSGDYPLLRWKRQQLISNGIVGYLIKIIPIF
jgi:hypothetical protein